MGGCPARRGAVAAMAVALLAAGPAGAAAAAPPVQEPAELARLAGEQLQLADQARRLERLLQVLEERDRASGREQQAEFLAAARKKLREAGDSGDLVAALEEIAGALAAQRAGQALELQAEVIGLLQSILDQLLQRETREQLEALRAEAAARRAALEDFARAQERLLERTETLTEAERQVQSGDVEEREGIAEGQRGLDARLREFAAAERRGGRDENGAERAAAAGEEAAEALAPSQPAGEKSPRRPAPGENLDRAAQKQREALEQLRRAAQQARRDEERAAEMGRMEALLDLAAEAAALRSRHLAVLVPLREVAGRYPETSPPRSERVRLREWAEEEAAIASSAAGLRTQVLERGADTVPFLLGVLQQDHERLARRLGPPEFCADEAQAALGERIATAWETLIESLREEAERVRQKLQRPPSDTFSQQESPLVNLAAEIQLLKRLEEDLRGGIESLERRREILAGQDAALDEEDLDELQRLVDRQAGLRRLYEAILERLREAVRSPQEPPASEEEDA